MSRQTLAPGSSLRFIAAALLAPLAMPAILFSWLALASLAIHGEILVELDDVGRFLRKLLVLSAASITGGFILRKLGWTRLRHHMLAAFLASLYPLTRTLTDFFGALSYSRQPDNDLAIPYPCAELVRDETFDLGGSVLVTLYATFVGAAFKWIAYGFTRERAAWGWKVPGAVYLLACALVLVEPFHYVDERIPSWLNMVRGYCKDAIS